MTTRLASALSLCGALLLCSPAVALPAVPGAATALASAPGAAAAPLLDVAYRHHRRFRPGGSHYYHVNRYGFGNYRRGPHGGFGGYRRGSAGAIELRENHRIKCRNTPSRC